VRSEPREQAAVELDLDLTWDDVDLQATADDGGVDGVVERGVQVAAKRGELAERGIRARRLEKGRHLALQGLVESVSHRFELQLHGGRDVDGQAAVVELGQERT